MDFDGPEESPRLGNMIKNPSEKEHVDKVSSVVLAYF